MAARLSGGSGKPDAEMLALGVWRRENWGNSSPFRSSAAPEWMFFFVKRRPSIPHKISQNAIFRQFS
jgi:hypothetical protein